MRPSSFSPARYRSKLLVALFCFGLFTLFVLSNVDVHVAKFRTPKPVSIENHLTASLEQPVGIKSQVYDDALQQQQRSRINELRNEYMYSNPQPNILDIKPFRFLKQFKNPCWAEKKSGLRCLPYFYLVGAPKSGTTDLNRRLVNHPQISSRVAKEPHWLTRQQFRYDVYSGRYFVQSLTSYLSIFSLATKELIDKVDSKGYHKNVFGDCSASTLWDNFYWKNLYVNTNMTEPLYTNPDYVYHLNPKAKIIAILRNPIDRAYSEYLYFSRSGKSQEIFDNYVRTSIRYYSTCSLKFSLRACVYSKSVEKPPLGLNIGLYHIHLKEWFRVFPRDQIMIINLSNFTVNTSYHMKKVFLFLDVDPSPRSFKKLTDTSTHANSRRKADVKIGPMWNSTRKLLFNFYKKHNDELVQLLGKDFDFNTEEGQQYGE